jgi:hypothetical protein
MRIGGIIRYLNKNPADHAAVGFCSHGLSLASIHRRTVRHAVPVPDQEFLESVFTASVATFVAASPRLFVCSPNALNCISINSV